MLRRKHIDNASSNTDMKKKAIFLDRDGTINNEKEYLFRIEDFELLPGVVDALKILQELGFKLIIITNQSGIARGYFTLEDYKKLNTWMVQELKIQGIDITNVYFCPHHPDATISQYRVNCSCRKPKLGMFEKAVKDYDLELGHCFAIGDKIRDCSICKSTDCHGFLIAENEKNEIIQIVKAGGVRNVEYASDLMAAAEKIKSYLTNPDEQ